MGIQPGPLPDPRQPTHTLCSQVQAEEAGQGQGQVDLLLGVRGKQVGAASSWPCDLGQVTLL